MFLTILSKSMSNFSKETKTIKLTLITLYTSIWFNFQVNQTLLILKAFLEGKMMELILMGKNFTSIDCPNSIHPYIISN